jgi:hypothetical protein
MSISCVYVGLFGRATLVGMRWERLFDDLEAQLEAGERDEFAAEVADRTRREVARVHLVDRLRRAVGVEVELSIAGAGMLSAVLRRVGPGWLLVEGASRSEVLVTAHSLLAVRGLPVAAAEPAEVGLVSSRLDLGHLLRAIARDRAAVTLTLQDGSCYIGTVDRVGADFLDLAEHASDEPRRAGHVTSSRTLTFASISMIRTS